MAGPALPTVALVVALAGPAPDTVRVRLVGETAIVEQRIHDVEGLVEAHAIRLPGQTLAVEAVEREGERLLDATLVEEPGSHHLRVLAGAPVRIRYRVSGVVDRIPLFVGPGPREITVARGVAGGAVLRLEVAPERAARLDLSTSLPRFSAEGDGVLIAEPPAVPAFIRLSGSDGLAFTRWTDLAAIALILLGVAWAWRRGARARRGPARNRGTDTEGR